MSKIPNKDEKKFFLPFIFSFLTSWILFFSSRDFLFQGREHMFADLEYMFVSLEYMFAVREYKNRREENDFLTGLRKISVVKNCKKKRFGCQKVFYLKKKMYLCGQIL